MSNEAQKTPKIAPRGSLTMRINPKPARERVLYPEHPRRYFPIVDEKLFDGLQLSVFLPHILNNNSSTGRLFPTRTYFSSGLSAEQCLGVPLVYLSWPKQKLRKNFFVQNDQAQYGREFFEQIININWSNINLLFILFGSKWSTY